MSAGENGSAKEDAPAAGVSQRVAARERIGQIRSRMQRRGPRALLRELADVLAYIDQLERELEDIRRYESIHPILSVATDSEISLIDELRRRAGQTWEHIGCWTNLASQEHCERCGKHRVKLPAEDLLPVSHQPTRD